ncbi:MAG: class I SAM-dependent RNA methyltransferase [Acutalibacteraceae bacterium]
MTKFNLTASCLLGLEGIVAGELRRMGAEDVMAENGRVVFKGSPQMIARANIRSRYSERILILLSTFKAYSFEELFQNIKSLPWEEFIGKNDAFPVSGSALSSKLMSVPDCQKIIKKAVVERLKSKYKIGWFEETGALYQIRFLILKDNVSVMIDTSGAPLHKRGYREISTAAPIKETLAAAMADLSHVKSNHTVIDPMCGSGTLLIEAALKAKNISPGINRSFVSESWSFVPESLWNSERELAESEEITECGFKAFGFDIDENAIKIAQNNAKKAGVSDVIEFKLRDVKDFLPDFERGTVICNPPYGERLLDVSAAREIYRVMGERFIKKPGWSYTVISPDEDFESIFGRKADKQRKLYNGMIKCRVYMFFKN